MVINYAIRAVKSVMPCQLNEMWIENCGLIVRTVFSPNKTHPRQREDKTRPDFKLHRSVSHSLLDRRDDGQVPQQSSNKYGVRKLGQHPIYIQCNWNRKQLPAIIVPAPGYQCNECSSIKCRNCPDCSTRVLCRIVVHSILQLILENSNFLC